MHEATTPPSADAPASNVTHAKPRLHLDFVSDVVCPWCAVGLASLEQALREVQGDIDVVLQFHPFELNPTMAPEGVASGPYLKQKYGLTDEQLDVNRARIVERGAAAGFAFGERHHIWGTFDAHRLLHWAHAGAAVQAQIEGGDAVYDDAARTSQHRLKRALIEAYHRDGKNPSDPGVLLDAARAAGLDVEQARSVLERGTFANEVRTQEAEWQSRGITGVPALIVNDQYVIAGGQTSEMYARALRHMATQQA